MFTARELYTKKFGLTSLPSWQNPGSAPHDEGSGYYRNVFVLLSSVSFTVEHFKKCTQGPPATVHPNVNSIKFKYKLDDPPPVRDWAFRL